MKSREIFPEDERLPALEAWQDNDIPALMENYIKCHKALTTCEDDLSLVIQRLNSLTVENQGLKLAIEKNFGGNCVIAPKEQVDKIAKERYEKALQRLGEKPTVTGKDLSIRVQECFKIAAGINFKNNNNDKS